VGFEMEGKAFPRHGYAIWADDEQVGHVTSGTFSPTLEEGIGTGYVPTALAKVGTPLAIEIRSARVPARVCNTPFVSSSPH